VVRSRMAAAEPATLAENAVLKGAPYGDERCENTLYGPPCDGDGPGTGKLTMR
jgi:hypothetical protein